LINPQVKVYFTIGVSKVDRRDRRADRRLLMANVASEGANRSRAFLCATLRREPMTPILLLLAFLLVLDVLVLLGRSHDSPDGRDWQPRGSPSRGPSAVAPI
jgi:hypothetical protein